ncbi:MAG TPA: SpoIIE family protein phosphatase [Dongiaceae bacterium]|nr:SpoIIE family protein phosphatase [Dongiaceae bacterium]
MPDLAALVFAALGLAASLTRVSGGASSFLKFVGILSAGYLAFRAVAFWRSRLLWSLRNRLIVAYLFIAVVPVLLLVTLAALAGQIFYSQLGGYLLYEDIHGRLGRMADSALNIAAAEKTLPASLTDKQLEEALDAQIHVAYASELPGLKVEFHADPRRLARIAGANAHEFTGILQNGGQIHLVAMREIESPRGKNVVELSLRLSSEFLETVAPDLGPIQVTALQKADSPDEANAVQLGSVRYRFLNRIGTRHRALQPGNYWFDPVIDGFSKLDATYLEAGERAGEKQPVFASFTARPSVLNGRIFSSLGEFSGSRVFGFELVAIFLLLIEIAALVTGIVLTRAITSAVGELYKATQHVQEGDLGYKVKIERRDQLGILGESFNLMTGSISSLIQEQRHLQRLENEISIAREVQDQLFPQRMPSLPGVEIEAICRAARTVSGDYYDFIELSPTRIAIAIADISGKGISAALLMASLQAALRSQLLAPGSDSLSTAELVSRLNKHLVRNTGDDRFATFFIAVYDTETRELRYTNAGHLPSFCICGDQAIYLDKGGIVLGVVEDYPYVEGSETVPASATLVGYSDGLVEPENVYGEEFGIPRLRDAAIRLNGGSPKAVANGLMQAAEEWAGTPEQADDMTVIIARLR